MTTLIHRVETEQDKIKNTFRNYWNPAKGLAPSHVKVLDAMLLCPDLKVVAVNIGRSEHTVCATLKIISKRYKLHKQSDMVMWWALWLQCYVAVDPNHKKHIPVMPAHMWPFNMRK